MRKFYSACLIFLALFSYAQVASAQKIFWIEPNTGTIKSGNLSQTAITGVTTVKTTGDNPRNISLDANKNYIFYTNAGGEGLMRTNYDGSGTPLELRNYGAFTGYTDIAYSENAGGVFGTQYGDEGGTTFSDENTPDSSVPLTLDPVGNDDYGSVAVDDGNEYVYFVNYSDSRLYRTDFSGDDAYTVVSGISGLTVVAADEATGDVYFVAANASNILYRCAPDGNGLTSVAVLAAGDVTSLAVYSAFGKIYYMKDNVIRQLNLDGTGDMVLLNLASTGAQDLAIEVDLTSPVLSSFTPPDNATNVGSGTNLTLTFNEAVKKSTIAGTANETSIRIYRASDDGLVQTINRTDAAISVSGATVTVTGIQTTLANTDYYVQIGTKVFMDISSNWYVGINSTTAWNFQTAPGVTLSMPSGATCPGSFVTLNDIVITEIAASNINGSGSAQTLILGFSGAGYSWQPGTGSVTTNSAEVTIQSFNVTATAITITYSAPLTPAALDRLTISGLQFTTSSAANPGIDIIRTGGTGTISGLTNGTVVGAVASQAAPAAPAITMPAGTSFCQGVGIATTTLVTTTGNTRWYTDATLTTELTGLAGATTATAANLGITTATATTFERYVTVTPGACQSSPSSVLFTIDAAPTTAAAGTDQQVCAGTTTLAGNTPSTGSGSWTIVSGTGGLVSTPATPSSTFTGVQGSTYVLRWIISNGSCIPSSDEVTIQFIQSPTTASAGTDQEICGTSATLAANTPTVGSGAWSVVTGTGGSFSNTTSPTATFTGVPGISYTLRWTISNFSCTPSSDDVIVSFFTDPTTAIAGPPQTVCGTSVSLAGNTPSAGTGAWTVVSGIGGTITTPGSPTSTFTGVAGNTYALQWTIANGSCTPSQSIVSISLVGSPTPAAAGPDQQSCGTSATLAANTPTVGTGMWTLISESGGNIGTPTSATSQFTGTVGASYTLQWTTANPGCPSSTDDVVITLIEPATTAAAGADQTVCGNSTVLTGNTPASGTGTWSVVSGAGGTIATPSSPNSVFTGTNGVTYILRWTITKTGCATTSDEMTVHFNPLPSGAGEINGLAQICPGVTGTYTVTGIQNATSYRWTAPDGTLLSQSGPSIDLSGSSLVSGTLLVGGVNDCGEGGAAKTDIVLLPRPEATIFIPNDIFIDEEATFSFNSSSSIASSDWSFGDGGTSTGQTVPHTYTSSGDFEIALTIRGTNECGNVITENIVVNPEPSLSNFSIRNVVTPNGDEKNRYLTIDRIEKFPDSEVVFLDRLGVEVFRKRNYDNLWDLRKGDGFIPAGNYVCVVIYNGKTYSRSVTVLKGR